METDEVTEQGAQRASEETEENLIKILKTMNFQGTRYPHRETMEALGIREEVEGLIEAANLQVLMKQRFPTYKDETCQFLATMKIYPYVKNHPMVSDGSLGYIYFKIDGVDYTMSF